MDTPIFDALAEQWGRSGRHHWAEPDTGPVTAMGRHHDSDSDGLADQADPDPHGTGDDAYPSWPGGWQVDPTPQAADGPCEDRADPSSWLDPAIVDEPTEGRP